MLTVAGGHESEARIRWVRTRLGANLLALPTNTRRDQRLGKRLLCRRQPRVARCSYTEVKNLIRPVHYKAACAGVQPPATVRHELLVQLQLREVNLAVDVEERSTRCIGRLHLRQCVELFRLSLGAPVWPLLAVDHYNGELA
eukprot:SAG11_NODE_1016_length_6169_cov_19.544975_3_plen_142_part_00